MTLIAFNLSPITCSLLLFTFYLVPTTNYLLPTISLDSVDEIVVCGRAMLKRVDSKGWQPVLATNLPTAPLGFKTERGNRKFLACLYDLPLKILARIQELAKYQAEVMA